MYKPCQDQYFCFFIFFFSPCKDSITKIKNDDWFFSNIKYHKIGKNFDYSNHDDVLGRKFDLVSSYSFLSITDKTACFSPICAELNFHLQLIHKEYEDKYCLPSTTHLKILINKIRKVNKNILNTNNFVYMPAGEAIRRLISEPHGYRFEVYGNKDEFDDVCEAYKNWISKVTNGLIESTLPRNSMLSNSRIYVSSVLFKEDWLNKFKSYNSYKSDFKLSNDKTVERIFMNKKSKYRYKKLINDDGSSFEMVAVPYLEKNDIGEPRRVMVYLIPENNKIKQADLWDNFYKQTLSFGGIKQTILEAEPETIDLFIPKIQELKSNLDTNKIFDDIFKERNSRYVSSEMDTYLEIDEDGTKAAAVMKTVFTDGISHTKHLRADVPHIAFIYDFDLDRILFILNDNGPV